MIFLKIIVAIVSFCLSVLAYVAIIFSGDNAPQPSWRASAAGFFNGEIMVGVAAILLVAISLFWLVKRPSMLITPFDLLIVVAPASLWSLLLLIHLI